MRAIFGFFACLAGSACAASGAQYILGHAPTGRRRACLAGTAILSLASLVSIPIAHASCRLEEISEFHVELVGNSPIIEGEINGQPVRIVLDTGSDISHLTSTAARQLNLALRSEVDRGMVGPEGYNSVRTTVIKEFKIGKMILKNYTANVAGKVIYNGNGVASFELGSDVLSQFTTEWDLAHGVVRLLHPQDCQVEQLAYWAPSYFRIDLEPQSRVDPSVEFEVHINGKSTKAVIDSGDANSHIRPEAAREVGVDPSGPDAEPAGDITGLAPQPIPTWIGRFNTFEVGGETINNAHLLIGELSLPAETEYSGTPIPMRVRAPVVHLGADFLRANRLIIVPEKHVALFTYNGGAVFQTHHPE